MNDVTLQVSEAIALINQAFDQVLPFIVIEGEVASFKVSQGKFAFFDMKDAEGSIGCFMMAFQLLFPLEDGMKVRIVAQPKLTAWGKFSLTVREISPVGEGTLKKAFELLKAKLEKEGLFDESRKRSLPVAPQRIGVVSSSGAAGYKDFLKILDNRWAELSLTLVDVPVQGAEAPQQIMGAIQYLNEGAASFDVIAIVRGGGSQDDLSTFNHEGVARAIAASRTPTIVGVGHEVDTTIADLVADKRAATPSNAAELLVQDKKQVMLNVQQVVRTAESGVRTALTVFEADRQAAQERIHNEVSRICSSKLERLTFMKQTLKQLNPDTVLKRGYSIARKNGTIIYKKTDVTIGDELTIQLSDGEIGARVLS
jgi:exodeoxyribonuclease VII large subunit